MANATARYPKPMKAIDLEQMTEPQKVLAAGFVLHEVIDLTYSMCLSHKSLHSPLGLMVNTTTRYPKAMRNG